MKATLSIGRLAASGHLKIRPIGVIHTPFRKSAGVPIQSAVAKGAEGMVEVFEEFAAALADLDGFDRVWLLYWFHRARAPELRVRPFLDSVKRGLFATRAPSRPNPIGLSSVRLLAVEGTTLRVADVDMLDNTPLLDIKPYVAQFDCFGGARCGWLEKVAAARAAADDRFERKPKSKEQ
jgi:tRNA-Thr(GGU) m(6)t(6)A37 methyltransferase TsaA